jgi:LPPG:FO 2-phospho-L-lactate transferase
MHVERTRRLRAGRTLSETTQELAGNLGLSHRITPMSDDPVRTVVETDQGPLAFQHYFVRERCVPVVRAVRFEGAARAQPAPAVREALARRDLSAIVICPSNPYLSVDPILAVPGLREALAGAAAPCVAVSPIVGGQALKGPAAKLMAELGLTPGNSAVAAYYRGLVDGLVIDRGDGHDKAGMEGKDLAVCATDTIMTSDDDRIRLAQDVLAFAARLAAGAG